MHFLCATKQDRCQRFVIPNKKRRTVCDQTTMKTKFMGGALSFKGDAKAAAKKKKKSKSKHSLEIEPDGRNKNPPLSTHVNQHNNINNNDHDNNNNNNHDDDKTEAERRALIRKRERERKDLEKLAQKSHRETIEEFNEKLGELTEHNDIPRVSAAGNG